MADSLLGGLTGLLTPDVLGKAATVFGENQDAIGKGMSAVMPLLLGGAAEKASNPDFASTLFNMVSDPKVDTGLLDNVGSLLGAGGLVSGPMASMGGSLISSLFGSNENMVAGAIAKFAGVSPATANSLLKFGAPLVLGTLGKKVKSGGLNMGSLVGLLSDQKSEFTGALPGGLGNLSSMLDGGAAAAASAVEPVKEAGSSIWRWLLPLLLVLGALWLLTQFTGGSDEPGQPTQIQSGTPSVNLYFDLGSADLPAGASGEVSEIVSYMKANPTATASIAGYHDRSGAAEINEQLAKDRAVAVQRLLVAGGIDANRLVLDEPLIASGGSADDARRVEVVVR